MYYVTIRGGFSSAHNLRNYCGNCENLHGHNWKVDVTLKGELLDKDGMLVDFRVAKKWLKNVLGKLDHAYLNKAKPFIKTNPTSENIAAYIFSQIKGMAGKVKKAHIAVHQVRVWENENSAATYEA